MQKQVCAYQSCNLYGIVPHISRCTHTADDYRVGAAVRYVGVRIASSRYVKRKEVLTQFVSRYVLYGGISEYQRFAQDCSPGVSCVNYCFKSHNYLFFICCFFISLFSFSISSLRLAMASIASE